MSNPRATVLLAEGEAALAQGAALLLAGGLVAFATETVYGLGADATSGAAVAGIYAAKGRPAFNPLIAHVAGLDHALREGVFPPEALALARAFWPGPLTLVVPVAAGGSVCDLARAGLDTVALRVPGHGFARSLIERAGRPIAAPSANRSGHVSPTLAGHVLADLSGRIDLVIDGGAARVGVESTVVACVGSAVRLLRPGEISRAQVEAVIGRALNEMPQGGKSIIAPGQLASHYAPRAALRLFARELRVGEAGLDFGGVFGPGHGGRVIDLSPGRDLAEAAANLFSALRTLDASGAAVFAVAKVPEAGLGEAINDRLRKAAAPRA